MVPNAFTNWCLDLFHASNREEKVEQWDSGRSKAKLLNEAQGKVTFNDVAGVEEAKEKLKRL